VIPVALGFDLEYSEAVFLIEESDPLNQAGKALGMFCWWLIWQPGESEQRRRCWQPTIDGLTAICLPVVSRRHKANHQSWMG
jgi:hypothetical protein